MTWEEGPLPPTSEERQAQALRNGLDHELAAIQATDQARERLVRATAARTRAGHGTTREPRRLRPALALPLAGALVAAVIAAAVVIPTFLRAGTDTVPAVPASGDGPVPDVPTTPAPTPDPAQTAAPTLDPQPVPTSIPRAAPAEEQPAAEPSRTVLRLNANPSSPESGQRFTLTIRGLPDRHGDITVDWADDSNDTAMRGNCDARTTALDPILHRYARAGRYQVKVTVDLCGTRANAELTARVGSTSPNPVAQQ